MPRKCRRSRATAASSTSTLLKPRGEIRGDEVAAAGRWHAQPQACQLRAEPVGDGVSLALPPLLAFARVGR